MKQVILTIAQSAPVARGTVRTVLSGDTSAIIRPGQFINILLDNKYLRRPLSVCDCVKGENGRVTVIYKIVGEGTLALSRLPAGARLDVLTGLGNGYDTAPAGESPLLIGGGAGVPPMYMLCRELISLGKSVQVIAGWNSADEAFYTEEFRALGAALTVVTADGTMGIKGLVTDAMKNMKYSYIMPAAPFPCLKRWTPLPLPKDSSALRSAWAAASGPAWGAAAKQNTAISASAATAPCLQGRK